MRHLEFNDQLSIEFPDGTVLEGRYAGITPNYDAENIVTLNDLYEVQFYLIEKETGSRYTVDGYNADIINDTIF